MTEPRAREPASPEEQDYLRLTPTSREIFLEGTRHLPGGDSRTPLFHQPYPAVIERGQGAELIDVDGNVLLDFTSNHSSLILGNAHPSVVQAARTQLEAGTAFPGTTRLQVSVAAALCNRIPSLDLVRFTNSGTEAVIQALRAARAFTGRSKIAKVEGGYHGSFEGVLEAAGDVVQIPFNEPLGACALLEEHANELAAVIVEPVMGAAGMIPADREYLAALREATAALGLLLIFDEVISFRVAHGGAQEHYGVTPDLTCLGKAVGGGFPLGAFGGRADVMALFDPAKGPPVIRHPGSYNANPVSLIAAATTLELLTPEAVSVLNARGATLRRRIADALSAAGVPADVTGLGSLFAVHFTEGPVKDHPAAAAADAALRHRFFLGLYTQGVLVDPRGVGCASLATGDAEIERFIEGVESVLLRLAALGPVPTAS
jgi:glutamate-1-semialdehyde 2,1-aminomutase